MASLLRARDADVTNLSARLANSGGADEIAGAQKVISALEEALAAKDSLLNANFEARREERHGWAAESERLHREVEVAVDAAKHECHLHFRRELAAKEESFNHVMAEMQAALDEVVECATTGKGFSN
jgi:hypothetical protein